MQATILYLFAGTTIRAFQFNQSIITYFYIIIACFNLILTHCNIVIILFLPHYYILEIPLLHLYYFIITYYYCNNGCIITYY